MICKLTVVFVCIVFVVFSSGCRHRNQADSNYKGYKPIDSTLKADTRGILYTVQLKNIGRFGYSLRAIRRKNDSIVSDYAFMVPFDIYHFELGDIDGNGVPDILLGVIKSTHFHPEIQKRLFIYKIDEGRIRPMWMGSRISHEIIDFRFIISGNLPLIRSLEKDNQNSYLVAEYKWKEFGLALVRYISRGLNIKQAYEKYNL